MTLMSRSPTSDMFSVRGMGVAVKRQHVHIAGHLLQPLLVRDAEALLLVHDQQAQIVEFHVAREQPVRADEDVHFAGFGGGASDFFCSAAAAKAAEHFHFHRKRRHAAAEGLVVLEGQDGGRRQNGDLLAVGRPP